MIVKSYEIQNKTKDLLNFNLFLIYGENLGLRKDVIQIIKKSVNLNENNYEFISFYEDDILNNKENFYSSIYSGSLFGAKKIILINNGTDKIIELIKDVGEKKVENTYILISSEILEKKSKIRNYFEISKQALCVPCYSDDEKSLTIIAASELKKNNISLSREIINFLVSKSNFDRNNLRNEISKIVSFSSNQKKVELNQIKEIVNFSGEYKSDNFVNECLCGNISQYKKGLSELYIGAVNQFFLLRILSNKIQKLVYMKEIEKNYDNVDNLLNLTKPPIFWKEKPIIKKQLSIWNLDELKKIIYKINDIEFLCKKNPKSSKIIFFNFLNQICKKASNYS